MRRSRVCIQHEDTCCLKSCRFCSCEKKESEREDTRVSKLISTESRYPDKLSIVPDALSWLLEDGAAVL